MRLRAGGLILLLGPCLSAPSLAAQEEPSTEFGAVASLTVSRFGGLNRGDYTGSRVWITGGAFLRFPLAPGIALQPELLLVQKGGKLEQPDFASGVTITYVEVPVLARLSVPIPRAGLRIIPHGYAGLALGIKVRCRVSFQSGASESNPTCSDGEFPIKSTDLGIVFGGGVDLGRATVGARYELGATNIGGATSNANLKNRTLVLLAGWTFRAPR